MSALQIVAAGTKTVKLRSGTPVNLLLAARGGRRDNAYVPYLSAIMPGRIREGTFMALRMARR